MTRLVRSAVEGATVPAGKTAVFLWDSALPGFGVRINAGGTRSYVAQYRNAAGLTKRIGLGRYESMPIDDARRLARSKLAQAVTGIDPAEERAKARCRSAVTLGAVADAYLAVSEPRLKPRSHQEVARHLRTHWSSLRDRHLSRIVRADVAAVLREIAGERGPIAANRARASLSACFTWAIGEGMAETNPVVGTNKAADDPERDHVLTDAELVAVWNACRDDDHGRIVRILLLTAQRRDEVGDIARSEIHGAVWSIPASRTKNRRPHDVPLCPLALSTLSGAPEREGRDYVFGMRANGFGGWSKAKGELDARIAASGAAVRPWRLHDLRRTAATGMSRLGVLPHVIEAVLNHVSGHRAGVAGIYNRNPYEAEKRAALDAWAQHMGKLCGKQSKPDC